jgi:eukaryotic-like serine/threonine-protein kinase
MSVQRLGRYEILTMLGRGWMGPVFKAHDIRLDRIVALKVISPGRFAVDEAVARFEREGRSLAALQHPNIVTFYDFVELDGQLCLVMELVAGAALDVVTAQRMPLTFPQKISLMAQVCRAMEYAHERGVIHSELKPRKIFMLPDASPKIADFGISKIVGLTFTQARPLIGFQGYMSPEQFKGEPMTAMTDIFSAGVILFELLSGVLPFARPGMTDNMFRILLGPAPKLPDTIHGVPQLLHTVLGRALATEPDQRYGTAGEMAVDLEQSLVSTANN